MPLVYINGDYLKDTEAKISVFDRSYLFGEGFFESFRSHDGKIPLLADHVGRLEWSCTFLNLAFPANTDFKKICVTLLEKHALKNARFKIVLSQAAETDANVTVFCEPFNPEKISPTYKLKIIRDAVNTVSPLSAVKTTNYLIKRTARTQAREAGFDDGILLNTNGYVAETTTANIFWVDKNGRLWSVDNEQGCLAGIMRKRLISLIQSRGLKITTGRILPQEISSSREVFVTNSVIGIKPVVQIDNREISGGKTGLVTQMLMDLWTTALTDLLMNE